MKPRATQFNTNSRVRGITRSPHPGPSTTTDHPSHTHNQDTDKATTSHKTIDKLHHLTEDERDCHRQHQEANIPASTRLAQHSTVATWTSNRQLALGGLPLSPSTGRRALDKTEDQMQARCSNSAASHRTYLTGATATHVRRDWTRRALPQPT